LADWRAITTFDIGSISSVRARYDRIESALSSR
jgi:hypothetical protein